MRGDGGRSRTQWRESKSRRHMCSRRHRPKRLGGRLGGVVPQEKDHNAVAEERPEGAASSLLEPFRRRLHIAYCPYGVRELQPPRSSTLARSDGEIIPGIQDHERVQRRRNSRRRATRMWPTTASGPKTLPEQARRKNCKEIVTISADDDSMGDCEEQKGFFS